MGSITRLPVQPTPLAPAPQPAPEQGKFYTDQELTAVLVAHERALRATMLAHYEPDEPQPRHLSVVR